MQPSLQIQVNVWMKTFLHATSEDMLGMDGITLCEWTSEQTDEWINAYGPMDRSTIVYN